jgi:ketosteroid isomerase-like protein
MKVAHTSCLTLFAALATAGVAWAEDLRAEMDAANSEWLRAYNTVADKDAFSALYTKDAMLLPPTTQPIVGSQAIGRFWSDAVRGGNRKNHSFEIVTVEHDGKYAYQVSRWALDVVNDKGEITKAIGHTVRVFEKQPNGRWLVKVHIFNRT